MMKVEDYCWIIDKEKPNILQSMKDRNQCDEEIDSYESLNIK